MSDRIWQEAMAQIAKLPPAARAYQLGELVGWEWRQAKAGGCSAGQIEDGWQSVKGLADEVGAWVYDLYCDAFAAVTGARPNPGHLAFRPEGGAR